jgi:outer membrane receptor protein involved in Fe transport
MSSVRFLSASALATAAIVAPHAAYAQKAAPQAAEETPSDAIIVTGSRIKRPNDVSTVPITTVTPQDFVASGRVSLGDVLNDLPQLRSTVSLQNSTSGLGVRGLNLLDLRGLGTSRTLVLVNGRRHVSSEIINNGNAPDINTFPTDLIQRVDITTGGNSSIYGSDAVSGVVNFILNDNFDGITLNARAGISKYGDAGNQYLSGVFGKNFAEGRGNIAVNVEYSHQSDFYGSARPTIAQNNGFVVVDTDPAGSVNGSDGVSDRLFFRDIRSTTISTGGQLGIRAPLTGPCGLDSTGAPFTCAFLFQSDGSVIPQTGTRIGLAPNGNFQGGNGYSGRENRLIALSPDVSRFAFNVIGHFDISPAFTPFVEAKFVRSKAFGSQSGPFFSQGQTLGDGVAITGLNDRSYVLTGASGPVNREGIRIDNPYLSAAARTTITQQLTTAINAGINPNTGAALSAANRTISLAQLAAGTYRFSIRRNYVDLGIRDEEIRRDTYRVVGGVRGNFNDDWRYEVSLNYGVHKENNLIQGNVNRQRFLLASDSAINPVTNQIVCRSQLDAAYGGTDRAGNAANLARDIAACVPLNPFGDGSISAAAKQYLLLPTTAEGKATQFVASGFVSGDLSQLFELPGGPVAFSVGGEYRRETLFYSLDAQTQAGYAFYNAIPTFTAPSFEVKEAFGEIRIPLLKDMPLFHELTFSGSGRVAKYKGSVGTVYAYSGGVDWAPIPDIRFRGTYSRSVRAPYLGDLYSPQSQNFAGAPNDPCAARNLATGSATRSANCTAAGRPATYDFVYTSSLEILSGGNPNLKAEKSRSITLGAVIQPRFLPGFSVSADYYNIKIDDVIASVSAQNILNLCYDSATLNNPFCGLFQRAGASGGPRGEIPFRVLEGSLLQSTANFAKRKARGIDLNASYNTSFDWGKLAIKGVWTHVFQRSNFSNPADPNFEDVLVGELGDPKDAYNLSADLKVGKFSAGYSFRYISPMFLNTFEDYNALNGLPPQNTDYASIVAYPAVTYHDLRIGYELTEKFNLYGGVNNITDKAPPYGLTGVGAGSGIYDNRGRFMYIGVTAKF